MSPKNRTYLELNLGRRSAIPGGIPRKRPSAESPLEVFNAIAKAAADKRIRGIVLNLAGFSAGRSYLWELRQALEEFKLPKSSNTAGKTAGDRTTPEPVAAPLADTAAKPALALRKKIIVYLSQGDLDLYCLAGVADKIVLDATGSLSLLGYVYGRGFARHALEKIGVGVRELRYLKYKSAQESFTRDSLSDADKEQYGAYLDDIFAATKALLMESRSWSEEYFNSIINDEFLYSASRAKEKGLVD
jgi:protease-4